MAGGHPRCFLMGAVTSTGSATERKRYRPVGELVEPLGRPLRRFDKLSNHGLSDRVIKATSPTGKGRRARRQCDR